MPRRRRAPHNPRSNCKSAQFYASDGHAQWELLAADERCMVGGHSALTPAVAVGRQPTSNSCENGLDDNKRQLERSSGCPKTPNPAVAVRAVNSAKNYTFLTERRNDTRLLVSEIQPAFRMRSCGSFGIVRPPNASVFLNEPSHSKDTGFRRAPHYL
jgi:hypothetical protein